MRGRGVTSWNSLGSRACFAPAAAAAGAGSLSRMLPAQMRGTCKHAEQYFCFLSHTCPFPQGAPAVSLQDVPTAAHPAPSGLTAGGGLSLALAALEGGCLSELPPFSLMLPLESGPAAGVEAGEEAEQAAMAALECGAAPGAGGERQCQLMPPPPPRPAPARQPKPPAPTREQLAAAALAVAEAEGLASPAGWGEAGEAGTREGMADSFSGLPAGSVPPQLPPGLPAGQPSSRRATLAAGSAARRPPSVRMRQVRF